MFTCLETADRKQRDLTEIRGLHMRYGDDLVVELEKRMADKGLATRDRNHWKRLHRKAKSLV